RLGLGRLPVGLLGREVDAVLRPAVEDGVDLEGLLAALLVPHAKAAVGAVGPHDVKHGRLPGAHDAPEAAVVLLPVARGAVGEDVQREEDLAVQYARVAPRGARQDGVLVAVVLDGDHAEAAGAAHERQPALLGVEAPLRAVPALEPDPDALAAGVDRRPLRDRRSLDEDGAWPRHRRTPPGASRARRAG